MDLCAVKLITRRKQKKNSVFEELCVLFISNRKGNSFVKQKWSEKKKEKISKL